MNNVVLYGRLVADPEKVDAGGHTKTSFTIAVQRVGKQKDVADFFDVNAWRQTGDYVAAYQTKGKRVIVKGRLEQQRWETSEGQKRSRVVVVADQVTGLDYDAPADGGDGPVAVGATKADDSDIPF
jgi:single-strand DNA-binding protein